MVSIWICNAKCKNHSCQQDQNSIRYMQYLIDTAAILFCNFVGSSIKIVQCHILSRYETITFVKVISAKHYFVQYSKYSTPTIFKPTINGIHKCSYLILYDSTWNVNVINANTINVDVLSIWGNNTSWISIVILVVRRKNEWDVSIYYSIWNPLCN